MNELYLKTYRLQTEKLQPNKFSLKLLAWQPEYC
jgi:hypothetical protein